MQTQHLLKLCQLFQKRADLREDMAKRIFLSVIPAVSGKTELYHTQGFPDYNLLKSAANGANDVIKYGTMACITETRHYGYSESGDHKPMKLNQAYIEEHVPDVPYPAAYTVRSVANRYWQAANQQPKNSARMIDFYDKALTVCIDCFGDYSGWESGYGGRAWRKIAKTLYDLNMNNGLLVAYRSEPQKYDIKEEVDLMKHQIALMNVFDGLAHNTANTFAKVVDAEHETLRDKINDSDLDLIEREKTLEKVDKYYADTQTAISKMMDAKEISNPLQVYQALKPELDRLPQKPLYKDWISKIQRHPDFASTPEYTNYIAIIRIKKDLIEKARKLELRIEEAEAKKNEFIKVGPSYSGTPEKLFIEACHLVAYGAESIKNHAKVQATALRHDTQYANNTALLERLFDIVVIASALSRLADSHYSKWSVSVVEATNDMHLMKSSFNKLIGEIESLI